jgi:hypothetical protein
VNNFSDKGQRLQSAWSEFFEKQQLCEVVQVLFVCDCEHSSEAFQIDVFRANFVMRGHS